MRSILIINVPEDFDYRKCIIGGDGNIYYEREGEQRASIIGNIKNLRPLPEKIDELKFPYGSLTRAVASGYNIGLDEVLGEEEWQEKN